MINLDITQVSSAQGFRESTITHAHVDRALTFFNNYQENTGNLPAGTEVDTLLAPEYLYKSQEEIIRIAKLITEGKWEPDYSDPMSIFEYLHEHGLVPSNVGRHLLSPHQLDQLSPIDIANGDLILQRYLEKNEKKITDELKNRQGCALMTEDGNIHIFMVDPRLIPGDKTMNFLNFLSVIGHELGHAEEALSLGISIGRLHDTNFDRGADSLATEIRRYYQDMATVYGLFLGYMKAHYSIKSSGFNQARVDEVHQALNVAKKQFFQNKELFREYHRQRENPTILDKIKRWLRGGN